MAWIEWRGDKRKTNVIHLLTRLPLPYQRTLCAALSEAYDGRFVAWFAARQSGEFPFESSPQVSYAERYLSDVGYQQFFKELKADPDAVVILGGWSSPMTKKVLAVTTLLRVPVFIWADHPYPRDRTLVRAESRKLYLRMVAGLASGFLACGAPTVEHLVSLGIERKRIANFPYWVEIPREWSVPLRCLDEQAATRALRLVCIGRHVRVKQFEIAIEAVALANTKAGGELLELVLIGDGPERAALEDRVRAVGCESSVKFTGWLESNAVYAELSNADALVVTSKFEPYSVVVLEAMAAGRAVLAAEGVVAARDRDEGTGAIQFHPNGDVECLADQIAALALDREALRRASIAARATAEKWPPRRAGEILEQALEKSKDGSIRRSDGEAYDGEVNPAIQSKKARA
jgi:glycosyltransferase involved in cell wall biosynthesis